MNANYVRDKDHHNAKRIYMYYVNYAMHAMRRPKHHGLKARLNGFCLYTNDNIPTLKMNDLKKIAKYVKPLV